MPGGGGGQPRKSKCTGEENVPKVRVVQGALGESIRAERAEREQRVIQ